MRDLSQIELLSLTNILKLEQDGLALTRAIQTLISDEDLKKHAKSDILATETRLEGLQQFIIENNISNIQEVN